MYDQLHSSSSTLKLSLRIFVGTLAALFLAETAAFAQTCGAPANAIVAENCLTGNPSSDWSIGGAGDANIQGFASDISFNHGQTVTFKVKTPATAYRLDIYRMGYYAGMGARKIATVRPAISLPQVQPACLTVSSTGLIDCGNWSPSLSWDIPMTATSGVYFAKAVREDGTTGASHIYFIVRDDNSHSDVVFQTSDTTWHAYNNYGGNSLYQGAPAGRAYKISYNRPLVTRQGGGINTVWTAEYPMIRWLEANGYDVSYLSGVDTDRRGSVLTAHKLYLSVGHDEYWSGAQRAAVEAARSAGVHLAFFSGNEVFWKVRWENSIDGTNTPYRTMVCYKETHADAKIDPSAEWTGTWMDPRFSPPSDGGRPPNALTGTLFAVNGVRVDSLEVPEKYGKLRLWRNTAVANLVPGTKAIFPAGTLGYEWNIDTPNGFRPPGLVRLSETTVNVPALLQDFGSSYAAGPATHYLTLYRHSSGALVFSAGTTQWAWGLDSGHDGTATTPDVRMQQATVNLFADMGVQPATIQPGVFPATASVDLQAPITAFNSPAGGSSSPSGNTFVFTGAASDVGGGLVAGVEVSVDGGLTWNSATGQTNWQFEWTPMQTGAYTVQARAMDDSGNIGAAASIAVTVTERVCPCTIWTSLDTANVGGQSDGNPVELGMRFRANENGRITGIRFLKAPENGGVHVGHLWSNTGTLLGSVTFTDETTSGWQQAMFATPVTVTAGTTYVVSYFAPQGRYGKTEDFFTTGVTRGPLTALGHGDDGANGLYLYGSSGGFPTSTSSRSNYWVDVVFVRAGANNAPVAGNNAYSVVQGQVLTVAAPGVLGNDSDADGNALTAVKVSDPSSGTLTLNGDGGLSYTPAAGFTGTTSFTYRANDGLVDSNVATVTVTVTAANTAPVANSDTYSVVQGQVLTVAAPGVLGNDADAEGSALTAVKVTDPASGTAVLNANGSMTYTPAAGFTGAVSFTYRANDGSLNSNTATVTVNVTAPNNAPVAGNDSYTVVQGQVLTVGAPGVLGNDSDADGNALTAVKVTDPGSGTVAWAGNGGFSYTPAAGFSGTVTFTYRANDGIANSNTGTVTITVTPVSSVVCPCTIWNGGDTPAVAAAGDANSVELGMRFRASENGQITGVRFYKGSGNGGVHVGHVWSNTGTLLGSVTFSNETATGWQQAMFATPVTVTAGTTYVVSYFAPEGHYAKTENYFTAAVTRGLLTALGHGDDGANGVYRYGTGEFFPTSTSNAGNYWVDVVFVPGLGAGSPPVAANDAYSVVTGGTLVVPAAGVLANDTDADANALTPIKVSDPANGTLILNANGGFTYTPAAGFTGPATFTYKVNDGTADSNTASVVINVLAANTCPCTVWQAGDTPASAATGDTNAVELGMRFRVAQSGTITAVRFYKGVGNNGVHVGRLWTQTGTLLGTVTFTNETASGWQQAQFATPVAVTGGTTYVVSYHAPQGRYAQTPQFFTAPVERGIMTALADGTDGPNGVFRYGSGGVLPTSSFGSSNYWVDVVFTPAP